MNETLNTINTRRSIRAYQPEQISDNDLNAILEAGKNAASARGFQPWHFTVLQNLAIRDKIVSICKQQMLASNDEYMKSRAQEPNYNNFYAAPTVIIISGEKESRFAGTDCANATQNMAVAAHSLGISSCYIGSFLMAFTPQHSDELLKDLGIPATHAPMYALSLGYAAETPPERPARKEGTVNYVR